MASSSSLSRVSHQIFPSFHGPDVRRGFLSHLHNVFAKKEITVFNDQKIERGHTIGSELVLAIREAEASIVLLSQNYASSSWCLDELVEILKCKEASGQIVMPIFYDVDPSDVRKQKGGFGIAFQKTCEGETEEQKQRWVDALTYVATIAGEHSRNWTDEAVMVEKISTVMLNKLKVEEMKKEFRLCDIDQNGFITASELRYVLTKYGGDYTDEDVCKTIETYDVDGDGRISYDEFVKMCARIEKLDAGVDKLVTSVTLPEEKMQEMKATFMLFDVGNNGFITAADFQLSEKSDGKKLTEEEAYNMLRNFDADGNGRVSFDEFVKRYMAIEDEDDALAKKLVTDVTLSTEEMEDMIQFFKALDVDHNGFITAADFQQSMNHNGKKVTDEVAYSVIRLMDTDGDCQISFDEFVKHSMKDKREEEKTAKIEKYVSKKLNKFVKFIAKALT
ncbi:hypothetical protein HID58_011833 [Brassica napus]|uniref:Uncharacterized protein n=1 Tax=Brassica napus TaxID=3708 RepID=A0ABQ8E222_BRANA|nr:calmodulin-like protein 12 [Brassica napus]KAH0934716.1 hypothetical protein HID58_011833 [Brassica napus]